MRTWLRYEVAAGIFLAATLAVHSNTGLQWSHAFDGVVGAAFILFLGPPIVLLIWWACRFGYRSMETAIQAAEPIPSPDEISWRLYQEWGRPPTAQEVQIVQQALINRRNEQAVVGGLSLGAIYLAAHR